MKYLLAKRMLLAICILYWFDRCARSDYNWKESSVIVEILFSPKWATTFFGNRLYNRIAGKFPLMFIEKEFWIAKILVVIGKWSEFKLSMFHQVEK